MVYLNHAGENPAIGAACYLLPEKVAPLIHAV